MVKISRAVAAVLAAAALMASAEPPSVQDQINSAVRAFDAGDCVTAISLSETAIARPEFRTVEFGLAGAAFATDLNCDLRAKRFDKAYDVSLQATGRLPRDDRFWRERFSLEMTAELYAAAAVTFTKMMADDPSEAARVKPDDLRWILAELRGERARLVTHGMLAAVLSDAYHLPDPMASKDDYRWPYIIQLAEKGETKETFRQARLLEEPQSIVIANLRKETAAAFDDGYDLRHAVETRLGRARAVLTSDPASLSAQEAEAEALYLLGHSEEALSIIARAESQIKNQEAGKPVSFELDRTKDFLREDEVDALIDLGRYDAVWSGHKRDLDPNLLYKFVRAGQGAHALKALPDVYFAPGTVEYEVAATCAYALSGQTGQARAALDEASKDRVARFTPILGICTNDENAAAKALILELNSSTAIFDIEDLCAFDGPAVESDQTRLIPSRWRVLARRADVRSAVARAGLRVRSFPIRRPGLKLPAPLARGKLPLPADQVERMRAALAVRFPAEAALASAASVDPNRRP